MTTVEKSVGEVKGEVNPLTLNDIEEDVNEPVTLMV